MAFKTMLIIMHLLGLVLGLGAATVADFLFMETILRNRVTHSQYTYLKLVTKLVSAGLFVLVATGFAFFMVYAVEDPKLMYNPKVWAKVTIVGLIALNGFIMHHFVFPMFEKNINRPLMSAPSLLNRRFLLFACGAISGTSWYCALILGTWKEINFKYSYLEVLGGYFFLLGGAVTTSLLVGKYILSHYKPERFVNERTPDRRLVCPLTGAYNARYLMDNLGREMERAERYKFDLSVIYLDIEGFGDLNNRLGDSACDQLLKLFVDHLSRTVRTPDVFGRFAGDEFLFVLPHASPENALKVARRIKDNIELQDFDLSDFGQEPELKNLKIKISMGISHLSDGILAPKELIIMAELRMLAAKGSDGQKIVDRSDSVDPMLRRSTKPKSRATA